MTEARTTGPVETNNELKGTGYEIFVGILSVLSIVNLLLVLVVEDDNLDQVLLAINALLSVIFVIDFLYRLFTAPSKSDYFLRQFGWADLLASLPIKQFKVLRIFRLLRVVRLMRTLGTRRILRSLIGDRAGSALLTLLLMGILVLEFGSLAMLNYEQHEIGSNITSASDAIWYVLVTISTVGYGDRFPITLSGRILGATIILIGVGIFGTFTGYLANLFLAPKKADDEEQEIDADDPQQTIAQLCALLVQQQSAIDELNRRLQAGR